MTARRLLSWRSGLVAIAVLPIVVATIRALARGWVPIGDNGLLLLRIQDVFTPNTPLLGTWTSASVGAGRNINNPGPLWFDLLAPFVRILGPRVGLAVGVMCSNIAAVVVAAWAAHRVAGDRALVIVTMLSTGLAWAMGSELLFDVWQPNAMVLPFWAFLVVIWALAAGDLVMLPIAVGLASLVTQTHLSFVYVVGATAVAGCACAAAWWWRTAPERRPSPRRPLIAAAIVAVLAWSLPIVDQLLGDHNLSGLLSAGRGAGHPIGTRLGLRLVASVVALPPWWGRPGYAQTIVPTALVNGQPPVGRVAGLGASVAGLLVVFAVLAAVIWLGWRRREREVTTVGVIAVVGVVASLVSMLVSPLNSLGLTPHQMRWLWPVSALVLTAALVAATAYAGARTAITALASAAVVVLAVLTLPTYVVGAGPTADRDATPTIAALVRQLDGYRPGYPVLLDDTGNRPFEPFSGPVFAALGRNGVDVRVTAPAMVRQVGNGRRANGTETRQLVLREGQAALTTPPGATRVALVDGLDAAEAAELDALRAKVVEVASQAGVTLNDAGRAAARRGELGFAPTVLAPGADAVDLERAGWLRVLTTNGWIQPPADDGALFSRYAELATRRERLAVGVYEQAIAHP